MNISLRAATLVALSLFALAGCDNSRVVGTLTVNSSVTIVSPGGNKQVLKPGSYQTSIRAQDRDAQAFIKVSGKEVTFKIPRLSSAEDQSINISSASLGQEFGLKGRVSSAKRSFDRVVDKPCTYDFGTEFKCHLDQQGREVCSTVRREIQGTEQVREIGYETTKRLDLVLINRASQNIGNFSGSVSLGATVTDSQNLSGCSPY